MGEPKHTGGPWEIEEDEYGDWIVGPDGEGIAQMSNDIMDEETVRANTRLVKTTPKLLAALIKCRDQLVSIGQALGELTQPGDVDAMNAADSAIAEATEE